MVVAAPSGFSFLCKNREENPRERLYNKKEEEK